MANFTSRRREITAKRNVQVHTAAKFSGFSRCFTQRSSQPKVLQMGVGQRGNPLSKYPAFEAYLLEMGWSPPCLIAGPLRVVHEPRLLDRLESTDTLQCIQS